MKLTPHVIILTAAMSIGPLTLGGFAQVKINEFLANNVSVNPDNTDYDDFTDWVELYNSGNTAADIGGYYLTGDLQKPTKWKIPTGTSIPANGYLLIWCDGADAKPGSSISPKDFTPSTVKAQRYHANFKLNKSGEQVGLFNASGAVVDSITFGKQYADVSMGRTSEGTWAFFDQPTPEAANSTTPKPLTTAQVTGTVTFSIAGGFYSSAQSITLTASDGSDIYYTTDHTIPHVGKSGTTKYAGPISVSKSTALRARCCAADKFPGKVITNTYFIGDPRKIMTVSIVSEPAFLFDKTVGIYTNSMKGFEVPVSIEFFTSDGKQVARANAGMRLGSITNYEVAQKPLQIALRDRYGDPFVNYQFYAKPITKFDRFRLRDGGDAYNSSLINDALLDPICTGQTAVGIQAFRLTVLYINGEFYGLQDLREQFKDMYYTENYGIVDPTKRDEVRSQLTVSVGGGFGDFGLLEGVGKTAFIGTSMEHWELVNGTWNSRKAAVSLIKGGTFDFNQLNAMIDIGSFADCFILYDFGKAISWGHNQDMWKMPDGKMRWVMTDFDRAWMYDDGYTKISHNGFTTAAGTSPKMMDDTLFKGAVANTEFKNYFIQRYAAHLNSTFNTDRLNNIVDSIAGIYRLEIKDHVAKWSSKDGVKSVASWESEITTMKKYMNERPKYSWAHLETTPFGAEGGKANLTVNFSDPSAEADVLINGVPMCWGHSDISLYKNIPFTVTINPKPGVTFKGWEGGNGNDTLTLTLTGDKTVTANFDLVAVGSQLSRPLSGYGIIHHAVAPHGMLRLTLDCMFATSERVEVSLFDPAGRRVENLMNTMVPSGTHRLHCSSSRHATGIYYYTIKSNGTIKTAMIAITAK